MFKILVCPLWILAKMFHPGIGNAISKDEETFNHFKAKLASTINAIPCPSLFSKASQITSKGDDAIKVEDTTLDKMSNATKNSPRSKKLTRIGGMCEFQLATKKNLYALPAYTMVNHETTQCLSKDKKNKHTANNSMPISAHSLGKWIVSSGNKDFLDDIGNVC